MEKMQILGIKMIRPMIAAIIAETSTAPAAMSFALPARGW